MDEINLHFNYTKAQCSIFPLPEDWEKQNWKFRIVTKGRRFGATRGAEQSIIEYLLYGISPILWIDTINGNIDRYYERYFHPDLKQLPGNFWKWDVTKRILSVKNRYGNYSILDFRSADNPDNIEGFGYKLIFLNEAGIILKDSQLYNLSILPMLIDYPDSRLIAAGVPKGKIKRDGNKHKFYELYESSIKNDGLYSILEFTTYDNPFLNKEDIDLLSMQMSPTEAEQEIYGKFVDMTGSNPFAHQYDKRYHESVLVKKIPNMPVYVSIDFNLNPFAANFSHIWNDKDGLHDHTFDEVAISYGSIPAMIEYIMDHYRCDIANMKLTGDYGGNNNQLSLADRSSFFKQLQSGLGLASNQIITPRPPTHYTSRNDVNYILFHSKPNERAINRIPLIDFRINPKTCPETCRDMVAVQVDGFGEIIKKNRKDIYQRADFLDCQRYKINTFWKPWILKAQKNKINNIFA